MRVICQTMKTFFYPISAILQPGNGNAGLCPNKNPQSVIPAGFLSGNPAFERPDPGFPTEDLGNDGCLFAWLKIDASRFLLCEQADDGS